MNISGDCADETLIEGLPFYDSRPEVQRYHIGCVSLGSVRTALIDFNEYQRVEGTLHTYAPSRH